MKRLFISLAVIGATLLGVGAAVSSTARADTTPLTEQHLAQIRTNCVDAQSNLSQLHASDALMRVNRGQLYESISTKLMVPLNSRLVLNRLDGLSLVSLTTTYDHQLTVFRSTYQQYEIAMSHTLGIDCVKQPADFYDSVADTRTKRQQTHEAAMALQKTIQDYGREFDEFTKKFNSGGAS